VEKADRQLSSVSIARFPVALAVTFTFPPPCGKQALPQKEPGPARHPRCDLMGDSVNIAARLNGLAVPPSEASKVARCATADWNAPGDWKRKVVEAIERSANIARVFLLLVRVDDGWVTIPSFANKNGPPRFEPMSKYESWLARPLAVLPASDLLSSVYEKCEQIRSGSDETKSRKKP
jgi:hypothetical protein